MFFERRCPICGRSDPQICPTCRSRLRPAPAVDVDGIDAVTALVAYDDASARLILAAKNGGRRDLLRWAAAHLADAVTDAVGQPSFDLVTWVPAHPRQRRDRGYDQGEVLARHIGRRLGVRCRPTLRRAGGPSQKGKGRVDRLDGPIVRGRRPSVTGTVLLVDDVTTTGTSLRRSARQLMDNGAVGIRAAVIAASTGPGWSACDLRTAVGQKRT